MVWGTILFTLILEAGQNDLALVHAIEYEKRRLNNLRYSICRSRAGKRIRAAIQLGISLGVFSAYAVAANHCSFVPTVEKVAQTPSHPGCPGHHSRDKEGDSHDDVACCKSFPPAAFADDAKKLVTFDTHSFALQYYFATALIFPENVGSELRPLELDTGPPPALSFVESVLQRSILAHAPPTSLS